MVHAAGQVQLRAPVVDRVRQADAHSAEVVDHALEACEVEFGEVIESDPGRLLDRLPQAAGTAGRKGLVDLLDLTWLCGLPGRAGNSRAGQHRYDGVARHAQHDRPPQSWRQVQDQDGVGALAPDVRAEL